MAGLSVKDECEKKAEGERNGNSKDHKRRPDHYSDRYSKKSSTSKRGIRSPLSRTTAGSLLQTQQRSHLPIFVRPFPLKQSASD